MSYEKPTVIGETHALTQWYPAKDSYQTDSHGNLQPFVFGRIVKSADVDWPASHHFGEEVLHWRLGMESRCIMSTAKDIAHDTIKPTTIKGFEARYPEAFEEYRKTYGEEDLPDAELSITMGIPNVLIGEYKPKKERGASIAEKRKKLQQQLAELEDAEAKRFTPLNGERPDEEVAVMDGTPIKVLRYVPEKARETLAEVGVVTVEGLANLSEYVIPELGPGNWSKYQKMAKERLAKKAA